MDFQKESAAQTSANIYLGCAGWSLNSAVQPGFPEQGTHLERYAKVFPAVEINSSFYRPHRAATYARWRDSVPGTFRFSAKLPRTITHDRRLKDAGEELDDFLEAIGNLGEKLGCLLVQLPPSLQYDPAVAPRFLERLQSMVTADIACEPRHPTWFSTDAAGMLAQLGIARVRADPAPVAAAAATPLPDDDTGGGDSIYIRLHGSPVIYHSEYSAEYLKRLAVALRHHQRQGRRVWCIFDNTASGAAVPNALSVLADLVQACD